MVKHAPRIPEAEWGKQKERIVSLYLEPQSTLEHTVAFMKEKHGFEATYVIPRYHHQGCGSIFSSQTLTSSANSTVSKYQYRTKLKLWKVAKNATRDMYVWVDRETKRRALEGKATDVFLHDKPLSHRKLAKEIARNVTFTDSHANLEVSTPEGITIATPAAGDAGGYEESADVRHLPSLQLRDEVLGLGRLMTVFFIIAERPPIADFEDLVTDIIGSARVEEHPQYLLALNEFDDISEKEVNKSLWMWPEDRPLGMTICPRPSNPSIAHSTPHGLNRIAFLLFLAINKGVSWRVLYNILNPFIKQRKHDFLGFIYRSKTTPTRILSRLILYGAVNAADILVAREIIESGIKITSHDGLMTLAFARRNPKLVELLCKKGVPLEISEYPPDIFTKAEDVPMLRLLLEAGADPERIIEDGTVGFPLILAAERGSLEAVQLLLEHGARVDLYVPIKGGSALQAATAYGHYDIVNALLLPRFRADIDVPSNPKYRPLLDKAFRDAHCDVALAIQRAARTPIQIAAATNNLEMVRLLQSYGAHLNSRPIDGCHQELLETEPLKPEAEEYSVLTALQYAVANGNTQLVSLLLSSGAYPDLRGHVFGDTPLQMSARLGNEDLLRILLDYGAEVNAPPKRFKGRTALQGVAEIGDLKIAELLAGWGADVNAPLGHNQGMTAIQAAALGGNRQLFEFLLSEGADFNAMPAPIGGLTTLQAAATGGQADIITRLFTLVTSRDSVAPRGKRTALQAVIRHKNQALLEALVDHGADINSPASESSGTALQEALKHRWLGGVRYLLARGADVNARPHRAASSGHDLTALGWAIQNEDLDLTDMLLICGADFGCAQDSACSSPTALLFALHRGKSPDIIDLLLGSADNISSWQVAESALIASINSHYSTTSVYKMLLRKIPTISFLPGFFVQKACRRAWNKILLSDYLCPSEETAQIGVINLLLRHGVQIGQQHPVTHATCLQVALHRGCQQLAKFLLEQGASPDIPATADIATPLQETIDRRYLDIVEMILEKDVNVNAAPARQNGRTALQMAARDGMFGLAHKLLELGADVAAPPAEEGGRTAIDCAAENGRVDMVRLLLDAYKGDDGIGDVCERAAEYAENQGHVEISEWLKEYPS
jgi:ankyrin repeat protein